MARNGVLRILSVATAGAAVLWAAFWVSPAARASGPDGAIRAATTPGQARPQQVQTSALYRTKCASCHGNEGRGDGPVARALNPRPTNLWDPAQRTAVTDSAVRAVITVGRGTMPGFRTQLSRAQIDSLVAEMRRFRQ